MSKKLISILITIALCCSAILAGCTQEEKPEDKTDGLKEKIDFKIDAYLSDLTDSKDAMESNEHIADYLRHWAKAKGVSLKEDDKGNLFMHKDSSEEYAGTPTTCIICPYDHKQFDSFIYPMALSLYCIKNNESTGNLVIVFTPEDAHDFYGVRALNKDSIPENANIICLNASEKGVFALKSGASSVYHFSEKIKRQKPSYNKAYRISITGLPSRQPDSRISDVPNPITRLEGLLANLKSRNIGFEIADFAGGIDDKLYAGSCAMTVVVDPNKEQTFADRMNQEIESWTNKYSEDYPDAQYTFEPVKTPGAVLSKDDANKFVNYMYTLLNGEYSRNDEGDLVSICNISRVSMSRDRIEIGSVAYSMDIIDLSTIDMDEETLCSLSGINYEKVSESPMWKAPEDTDFSGKLAAAYRKATSKSLAYSESVTSTMAPYVENRTGNRNIICVTLSKNIVKDCTETIITYLISLNEEMDQSSD